MNKEQIERDAMEKVIADAFMADYNIGCDPCPGTVADALYLENYRKQSEGEWLKDRTSKFENKYNCSVCDYRFFGIPTPYCPKCGAKMKGV